MLRQTFRLKGDIRSARAYATSLGLYELWLNGQRVGDQLFTPGWTSYHKRLQYQTYDVTQLLRHGDNAVGAVLGDGWHRGRLGWENGHSVYGEKLALLFQLNVVYRDGQRQTIVSDGTWRAATDPIRQSDIYDGEVYDARLERPGWATAVCDDSDWYSVRPIDHPKDILVAPPGPPVRKIQEIRPVAILQTPASETVFDFGQNMVGWVRLKVKGPAGTVVTLRHAEILDAEGNFYTANLRSARQRVQYILKGEGLEVYEPHFSFQGFRYVALDGFPGAPTPDSLTGIVLHSDMEPTGHFECSNPQVNRLQRNIVWSQKGNFLDIPTDCPQRDERFGWTGDAQVFIQTAAFNMNVAGFFAKWLRDLAAEQRSDGSVPHVVPDILPEAGSAAWGDAATICPWTLYLFYGDKSILAEQYESMVRWVDYARDQAGDDLIWRRGFHFGDWLAGASSPPLFPNPVTSTDLIATAFLAHSTGLLVKAAQALGKTDDAEKYGRLLAKIKRAFQREFVTPSGRIGCNTQAAYVLVLMFDLLPEGKRARAARRLVELIRDNDTHLSTGFVSTPYVCHVLTRFGHLDVAYELLNQETCPSWLYPITQGATTIWEHWDGIKPDGSLQDERMNSFNHYANGAIGDWLYQVVAGIKADPQHPGFKHVIIKPQPGGGLTSARASLETMYGPVFSGWAFEGDRFALNVALPPNTWGTVHIPVPDTYKISESGKPLAAGENGIRHIVREKEALVVVVGSGRYCFVGQP